MMGAGIYGCSHAAGAADLFSQHGPSPRTAVTTAVSARAVGLAITATSPLLPRTSAAASVGMPLLPTLTASRQASHFAKSVTSPFTPQRVGPRLGLALRRVLCHRLLPPPFLPVPLRTAPPTLHPLPTPPPRTRSPLLEAALLALPHFPAPLACPPPRLLGVTA